MPCCCGTTCACNCAACTCSPAAAMGAMSFAGSNQALFAVASYYHSSDCCHTDGDHEQGASPEGKHILTSDQAKELAEKRKHWWNRLGSGSMETDADMQNL